MNTDRLTMTVRRANFRDRLEDALPKQRVDEILTGDLMANLGCGRDTRRSWLNVDHRNLGGVDLVLDLDDRPWPLPSDAFDLVLMDNVLEHLKDPIVPMDLDVSALDEVYRILRPGGKASIIVPDHTCSNAYKDPTHRTFFHPESLDYVLLPEDCIGNPDHVEDLGRKWSLIAWDREPKPTPWLKRSVRAVFERVTGTDVRTYMRDWWLLKKPRRVETDREGNHP